MSDMIQLLVEMGFDKERAERALRETGNMGVEPAMEWIFSHPDEPAVNKADTKTEVEGETSAQTQNEGAKSLKCEDCGKLFPGIHEAEFHATKSGHSNFTESTDSIKPLTEEEKQTQLLKVQEMLKQRRKEREDKEKQEQLDREKARRVMGREMTQAKQKFEEQEQKNAIFQRKKEKDEEKLARQRVKDQIERDRLDREAKFAPTSVVPPPIPKPQPASCAAVKDYTETKLQIRLLNGDKLTESFNVKETLAAVRCYVQQKSNQLADLNFTFSTTFPRKDFNEEEMQTPLVHLGLVPSAVLMVKKL